MNAHPHGRDLRKGRWSECQRIYLITTCCDKRRPIFRDLETGRLVICEMLRSDRLGVTRTYAYVVMPDHLHWLFSLREEHKLKMVVSQLKGRSARKINSRLHHEGRVWQAGFHDRALRKDEAVLTAADYIRHNPVRAGIVGFPDEYLLSGMIGAERALWTPVSSKLFRA